MGRFPDTNRVFVPVLCNHCEEPVCAEVCPTQATYQRADGVVMIDYEKCIGCCACIEHCPYHVRELVRDNRTLYPDGKTVLTKPVHQRILNKVAVKCDFCYHRVEEGQKPACCEVCPMHGAYFRRSVRSGLLGQSAAPAAPRLADAAGKGHQPVCTISGEPFHSKGRVLQWDTAGPEGSGEPTGKHTSQKEGES